MKRKPKKQAAAEHPQAFVIPAELLAQTIQLVGQMPCRQGAQLYLALTTLTPVE